VVELLKLAEVARRLGISEPTARRYVKTGKLPSVYVGGSYRVRDTDIEEFLRRAEVRPGENLPKAAAPSSEPKTEERRESEVHTAGAHMEGQGSLRAAGEVIDLLEQIWNHELTPEEAAPQLALVGERHS